MTPAPPSDWKHTLRGNAALAVKRGLDEVFKQGRNLLFKGAVPPSEPKTILVHRVGNVGDIIVCVPALISIRERFRDARIVLLTSPGQGAAPGAHDLLKGASYVDEIIVYLPADVRTPAGFVNLIRRIRALQPDLFIELPQALANPRKVGRDLLIARLTGADYATGFKVGQVYWALRSQARVTGMLPKETSRAFSLLKELGIEEHRTSYELGAVPEEQQQRVDALVGSLPGFFAVCPGGKQEGHLWPKERFAEVARRLREQHGLVPVAVGSPKEKPLCQAVLDLAGGGVNAAGELSLLGTSELLRRAQLLLTNDTGPMHMSAAMGTPVAAIFGSRDFAGRWWPYGESNEVFRAREVCDECLFAEGRSDHCIRTITPNDVFAGCERILLRRAAATQATAAG